MNKTVVSREEVVFYDTDSGGVVSNIAYLRYVEKARCALFAARGLDLREIHERKVFPTVVRTEIDYEKPAFPGDSIVVEAEIEALDRVRIHCSFTILREAGGETESPDRTVLARARQVIALLSLPSGKPVRVPREWDV